MPNESKDLGKYVLGRNNFSSMRLNLQHFLFKKGSGHLIHPAIPLNDPKLKIADVGTGTGVWMLDLSDDLPDTVELDGFDIDLSQTPVSDWTPKNIKYAHLDITKPLPSELEGQYDIVHLRLFMLVITKMEDARFIVHNLTKMLKPGGWLQWTEADRSLFDVMTADGADENAVHDLQKLHTSLDTRFDPASWITKLGEFYTEQGLIDVQSEIIRPEQTALKWLPFAQETVMAVYYEVSQKLPDGEVKNEYLQKLAKADQESRKGVAWNTRRYTWVGKKPLP